jgi:peptidyl-prolyl cis-trans isomerase D
MLQGIRDNSQGWAAKVIIGVIVVVFVLGAVGVVGLGSPPPVGEVNGEEITEAQLQFSSQQLLASIGAAASSLDQDLVEQIALNQLIEEIVLRQSAESASMSISDNRIDRLIVETEQFKVGGVFDDNLAARTIALQGYTVPQYRESLRQQFILAQLANAYSSSNFVIDIELERLVELAEQTRDFRYVSIPMGTRTLGIAINDAEIRAYYNDNQDQFREDEAVSLGYVLLDKNVISAEVELEEGSILEQYEAERSSFEGSAEKRASHILFEVGASFSEEQAMEAAIAAQGRIVAGEDFALLALELSSDIVSAEEGGDIGYTNGTAFPESIEEALEVLQLEEISDPIVSEFGVHLVKLTEDVESAFQSFEEVSGRLERELKSAEVELIYSERLADLSNLAFETGDLITISEELSLEILQSEAFSRTGGSGVFSNPALIAAAFSDDVLLEGNNSDVIELSATQSAVIRLREFTEAMVLPLAEVQSEIAVILRSNMERNDVQELGDELLSVIENGSIVETLLLENELEWINEETVSRSSPAVNRQIVDQAFAMPKPESRVGIESLTLSNGTFVVIELNQVNPGSMEILADDERESITDSMLVDFGNNDFQAYLGNLKESSDIQTELAAGQF